MNLMFSFYFIIKYNFVHNLKTNKVFRLQEFYFGLCKIQILLTNKIF